MLTRRCAQRQYLMRPDAETNNAFLYCLIVAAIHCAIDILMTTAQSNHHHTTLFDRYGRISEFMEYFHRLFARSQNALRARRENFWSTAEASVVTLLDRNAVIEKLVYVAANPVKDGLVERVHHWPGVNSYGAFLSGRTLKATRPRHFFRKNGKLPKEVSLSLTIPEELGPRDEIVAAVREGVERVEAYMRGERRKTGARVLGRRAILKESWRSFPKEEEPARGTNPRFAGSREVRIPAQQAYRVFVAAYRTARKLWLAGVAVLFPAGTNLLARIAKIPIAPPDSAAWWNHAVLRPPHSRPLATA
jgi:putative transposase